MATPDRIRCGAITQRERPAWHALCPVGFSLPLARWLFDWSKNAKGKARVALNLPRVFAAMMRSAST